MNLIYINKEGTKLGYGDLSSLKDVVTVQRNMYKSATDYQRGGVNWEDNIKGGSTRMDYFKP
jgi:hypothetical protein